MATALLSNKISLPDEFDGDIFSSLLLTFKSVDNADRFIAKTFPENLSYSDKFAILHEFFEFSIVGGYYPEGQSDEDRAKADYLFTLQHLLNKAKATGIKTVVKHKELSN
ncbi:MAG: hypothetical protein LBQ87_09785 [Candidatus Fibromonas sp.]|jgi:exonuclease III|nr:hypothetical protein [Candidatus Fibromonas sp.]